MTCHHCGQELYNQGQQDYEWDEAAKAIDIIDVCPSCFAKLPADEGENLDEIELFETMPF